MAGQTKEPGKDAGREGGKDSRDTGGKGPKEGKEKKDDVLARRLAEIMGEVSALRQAVHALQNPPNAAPTSTGAAPADTLTLTEADDALVARIGYALGSGPKVALARLLYTGGEQSASQLGEQAGLTTGSLYHHLRELLHAELVAQQTRNRYQLTERGRRALELFTPFAREGK